MHSSMLFSQRETAFGQFALVCYTLPQRFLSFIVRLRSTNQGEIVLMKKSNATKMILIATLALVIALLALPVFGPADVAFAQDAPAVDTPTAEPPTPTNTPAPSAPKSVPIPEPVTVILFGTGLAALSAAVAARRKKGE